MNIHSRSTEYSLIGESCKRFPDRELVSATHFVPMTNADRRLYENLFEDDGNDVITFSSSDEFDLCELLFSDDEYHNWRSEGF